MKEKCERYAEIKLEIADLEKQLEALKPDVLSEVEQNGEVILPLGRFSIRSLNKWTYTPAVKALEEAVKVRKIEEEEKGLAKATVTNSLTFTIAKI